MFDVAVKDNVRYSLAQVLEDCFKRGEIAVNIGNNGDAHARSHHILRAYFEPYRRELALHY